MTDEKLNGFTTSTIEINDNIYPIAVPDITANIDGKVLEVTDQEIAMIDMYETSAYRRSLVALASGEPAWLYHKPTDS